ncbi:hypothetical protein L596_024722 [Steinernema carpocapsae]|uniref:Uncharacterized protein n=1 Tax=Steinernema carpocapsae TaxID=34508 RepID=A0A4U5M5L4_STECR|nr:hypothetical protein L596_024722 [Steinernema carpocapsae]
MWTNCGEIRLMKSTCENESVQLTTNRQYRQYPSFFSLGLRAILDHLESRQPTTPFINSIANRSSLPSKDIL